MGERIIISPSELTEDEIQALEEFLQEKRDSIFDRWPEKNLRDIDVFIKDYREGRDRLEEEFLKENPGMTPEDWRDHLDKPREPQEYELEEPQVAERKGADAAAPDSEESSSATSRTTEQNESASDPRVEELARMAASPVENPGRSALLKPVEKLTESEMNDMIASAQTDYRGWRGGNPLKAHTYERVQDWHANIYGDGPQRHDGGKPVEPQPVRPIPKQPSSHTTPQGEDLWQASGRLGQKVANAAGTDGYADAVKALQRGLNILGEANPLPKRSPAYGPYTKLGPVTEDGSYGPQTDFALKHATARLGPTKVENAFAMGRFNTFARNAQRSGNAEGLEEKTHSIFGPLFRNPSDGAAPKVEAGVLQETLNQVGGSRRTGWQPLKVDNWIGPKTTDAFRTVLEDEDADNLTRSFGRGLGLL